MAGDGVILACARAVQPAAACTFIDGPGAMMSATTSLGAGSPSTTSCPWVFELIERSVEAFCNVQPGETTYHSGSLAASRSLSSPSVRQGSRPTIAQLGVDGGP